MDFRIVTETPGWFLVFCLLAGGACAWFLYRKDTLLAEVRPWMRGLMAVFRFLVVTLLAFLLMTPLIKTTTRRVEKPVIIVAQDNSRSIQAGMDSLSLATYAAQFRETVDRLGEDYEVRTFSFGEKVTEGMDFSFADRQTDISALFDDLRLRFLNRNVGAVILASDGLYNSGNNPVYSENKLRVPVYAVALGDPVARKDLRISKINYNRVAFLGNTIPMEVLLDARQCAGEKTVLTILKDSVEVFRKEIAIHGNRFHLRVPVYIDGAARGINRFDIQLSTLAGEVSIRNNHMQVFVEVTEKKQRVLVLAAAPHPDLAAIRSVIDASLQYEASFSLLPEFDGNTADASLVVLYQLPSTGNPAATLLAKLMAGDAPLLFVLGAQTDVNAFNRLQAGLEIVNSAGRINDALVAPAPAFSLFSVEKEMTETARALPPLKVPFGDYRVTADNHILLYQQIGAVTTTQPLLMFSQAAARKTAILCGEGFWKWRLHEFRLSGNTNQTSGLFMKVVQYLAASSLKTPFRVFYKNSFSENEPLLFNAELYDASGELINTPEVTMAIRNEQNRVFEFNFSRTGKAYQLDAGSLPAGKYRFVAATRAGDTPHRQEGEFVISPLQVEQMETTADHQLLFALADQSGGQLIEPAATGSLPGLLAARGDVKPVSYTEKKLRDLINLKWFFFVLAGFLGIEWFLRKRSGAY